MRQRTDPDVLPEAMKTQPRGSTARALTSPGTGAIWTSS